MSRILIPEYLINFARDIYEGPLPSNFGKRLIDRKDVQVLENWYKLFGNEIPANQGKRMVPNYLKLFIQNLANAEILEVVDDDVAYIKETPQNALKYAFINKVGGMSYKCNNLANVTNTGNRLVLANGSLSTDEGYNTTDYIEVIVGETYSTNIEAYATTYYASVAYYDSNKDFVSGIRADANSKTITIPSGVKYMRASYRLSLQENLMINKGSTLLPYQPYFTGIRYSAVTSINDFAIPAEVQALEGYGVGYDTTDYNVLDFETKKYTTKCLHFVLNKTDYDWQLNSSQTIRYINNFASIIKKVATNTDTPQILCDKLAKTAWDNLYNETVSSGISISNNGNIGISISDYDNLTTLDIVFLLATPIETDISDYIGDNIIDVSNNLTFNNEYEQEVPSEITYYVRS